MTHYALRNTTTGKLYEAHRAVQVYRTRHRAENDLSMFIGAKKRSNWEVVEVDLILLENTEPLLDNQAETQNHTNSS